MVDSGVDESSCFFEDDSGEKIEHGYYFEELAFVYISPFELLSHTVFEGGNFSVYPNRRKVMYTLAR